MSRTWRAVGATVALPLLLGGLTWLVIRTFADELPDPVATHWGDGSDPNGFSSRADGILIPPILGAAAGVVMGLVLWAALRKAPQLFRGAGGVAGFIAAFIGGVGVGSLWIQRGLTDAHQATNSGTFLGVGLAAGLLAAIIGWILMPGQEQGTAAATTDNPR